MNEMKETTRAFLSQQERILNIATSQHQAGTLFKQYKGVSLTIPANQDPLKVFSVNTSDNLRARYRPVEQRISMAFTLNGTSYQLDENYYQTESGLVFLRPEVSWALALQNQPAGTAISTELFKQVIEILSNIVPPTPPTPTA